MIWSFRTNGNYVDFVHTEETSLRDEEIVFHLHNTSRCISWSLPEDTTRISFTIDEVKYSDILITDIDFDGTAMNSQDDFETGITEMFPGLAGGEGGSSYLVYTALLTQSDTDAPVATVLENTLGGTVVWTRDDVGYYTGTLAGAFTVGKTICPPFDAGATVVMGFFSSLPFDYGYSIFPEGINTVLFKCYETATGDLAELSTIGGSVFIEIRVYP